MIASDIGLYLIQGYKHHFNFMEEIVWQMDIPVYESRESHVSHLNSYQWCKSKFPSGTLIPILK